MKTSHLTVIEICAVVHTVNYGVHFFFSAADLEKSYQVSCHFFDAESCPIGKTWICPIGANLCRKSMAESGGYHLGFQPQIPQWKSRSCEHTFMRTSNYTEASTSVGSSNTFSHSYRFKKQTYVYLLVMLYCYGRGHLFSRFGNSLLFVTSPVDCQKYQHKPLRILRHVLAPTPPPKSF